MSLSILNNITAMSAENQLNLTNTSLQNTLLELSSGSKLNSASMIRRVCRSRMDWQQTSRL